MNIRHMALALLMAAAAAGTVLAAQGFGLRAGVTVYEDINYGGRSMTFGDDVPNLKASGLEDKISSIKIPAGESWEVCDGRDFTGSCRVFTTSQPNLVSAHWNDRISSLRPARGANRITSTLELFAGRDYSGQRVTVGEPTTDLKKQGFADRAVSLRVPPGQSWEVCVNIDFDDCRVVTGNVPDLTTLGLARVISSARPHNDRGTGSVLAPRPRLVLYKSTDLRGKSKSFESASSNVSFLTDLTGSAEVVHGTWEVCDGPHYSGRCVILSDDVRDLQRLKLDGPIMSVRPR